MKSHFHNLSLILLLAGYAGGNVSVANDNDNDNTAGNPAAVTVSFDEVVEQIRQHKSWQILDARSNQKGSGFRYRFKLMNSSGQVRIILIDPKNPNLGYLEQ